VYPTGLVFTVQVHVAPEANDALRDALMHLHGSGRRAPGADDDGWRFGVRFADGRKATTFGRHLADLHTRPESPVLLPRGGGAGSTEAHQELWLWPLPPPGPLTFACAWPALELPETLHELDAGPIRAAADRAVTLWPETPTTPPAGGGWPSYP
jgi:hypothetical protein